jgi:hypothetical protein
MPVTTPRIRTKHENTERTHFAPLDPRKYSPLQLPKRTRESSPLRPRDTETSVQDFIRIRGARVHNPKYISLFIRHNRIAVVTGVSGSGKSSLAFDTVYAEGHRRYMECSTPNARQFLERLEKPELRDFAHLGCSSARIEA